MAERYLVLMREVALPDSSRRPATSAPGALTRREGEITHFEMLTFWTDLEAVKRFAGEDFKQAKYYHFDAEFLIEKEPRVRHYEAVSE